MTPEACPRAQRRKRALWQRLRARRLHGLRFRRQQLVDGFIVDFYCHTASLAVEAEGGVHHQQAAYDAERDRVLLARGIRILRIANAGVTHNLPSVLGCIAAQALPPLPPDHHSSPSSPPPPTLPSPRGRGGGKTGG